MKTANLTGLVTFRAYRIDAEYNRGAEEFPPPEILINSSFFSYGIFNP
jgi:hypothetical protein